MSDIYQLYLIADTQTTQPKDIIRQLPSLIEAGATCVQLRAKDLKKCDIIALTKDLHAITQYYSVPLFINDHVDIVEQTNIEGAHIGQSDLDPQTARKILGPNRILGLSIENLHQAKRDAILDVDYFGVGPIFATDTKQDAAEPLGANTLKSIRDIIDKPIVAIGGISLSNSQNVLKSGADGIALISGIWNAHCPIKATQAYDSFIKNSLRGSPELHQPITLTIAGSDSGGGAGIQADIKTITSLGGYACSVITALTAQNTQGVMAIAEVEADFVSKQLDSVFEDFYIDAVKIGMLHRKEVIEAVRKKLQQYQPKNLVIDPVMIAQDGTALLDDASLETLKSCLKYADLVTPNLPEAECLLGKRLNSLDEIKAGARALSKQHGCSVLIKGGHQFQSDTIIDIFYHAEKQELHELRNERIKTNNTHGTGCTLSAAIAAKLAQGQTLDVAVQCGSYYLINAIAAGSTLALGHGAGPVQHNYQVVKESI